MEFSLKRIMLFLTNIKSPPNPPAPIEISSKANPTKKEITADKTKKLEIYWLFIFIQFSPFYKISI